jgi:hypothetical protein
VGQVFDGEVVAFKIDAIESNLFEGPPFTIILRAFGNISEDQVVLVRLWHSLIGTAVIDIVLQNAQIIFNSLEDSTPIYNIETGIYVQGLTQQIISFRSMVSDSFTLLP